MTPRFMTPRRITPMIAACATLFLGACGSDSTGPQSGHASAVVTDNPGSTSPSAIVVRALRAMPAADRHVMTQTVGGTSAWSGSLTSTMQVAISADGQNWIDLGAPASSELQLQSTGNGTTLASQIAVPVGTYAYVRLVLQNATVQVTGTVGGIAYTNAQIGVGSSDQVVIEKQVRPFTITASTNATVMVDMNSEMWITAQSVQSQTAAAADVAADAQAAIN